MPDPRGLIPAIVLAAGLSTRMGRNKLLIYIRGKPVLHWAIDSLLAAGLEDIIVVTGHEADEVRECCSSFGPTVRFIHNSEFASGRATSIHAGLDALPAGTEGVMIMPADVPFVRPDLIRQLLAEFSDHGLITFPAVNGRKGHPVIFPVSAFGLLRGLKGDETLHDYLLAHPEATQRVECDDPGCLRDIDSPRDLDENA